MLEVPWSSSAFTLSSSSGIERSGIFGLSLTNVGNGLVSPCIYPIMMVKIINAFMIHSNADHNYLI